MTRIDAQIQTLLNDIEAELDIHILLAVESGSRAWGFPSQDSDYDIRFIYMHDKDWYASVFPKRDVIENRFIGDLDASGWDIRKALQLMHKGNAPLLEWLGSPIVYRKDIQKISSITDLAAKSFNAKAVFYHYLSLAKKKINSDNFAVNAKSFLYGFRALLCAKWIVDFATAPPVEFSYLVEQYLVDEQKQGLQRLLDAKQNTREGDVKGLDPNLLELANQFYQELMDIDLASNQINVQDLPENAEYEQVFHQMF